MERTEVGGLLIAYERAGSGPPLVLLHGYVGDGVSTWTPQIEAFCGDFTVIAWDAPGAGLSDDPPESFGMAGYADCLAAFLDGLGVRRASVAGLSFGGALAIAFAHRHPAVPRRLLLLSAYAGWTGSLPPDEVERRLDQALRLSRMLPAEVVATLAPTMFSRTAPTPETTAFIRAVAEFHPVGLRAMAKASADDLRRALPGIRVPTLLLYGADDPRAPRTVAEQLHAAVAGSRLRFLPGTGHVSTLENPQLVVTEMRKFLDPETAR